MKKSNLRLLLNAEPFGYGPAAAIATFFPHLRKRFKTIGYVGKGHTLDLQRKLHYDRMHDLRNLSAAEEQRQMHNIFKQYDLVLTATDFTVAHEAKQAGLKVIIYDPLTWYWPTIPKAVKEADLYLAQNFVGVRERIKQHPTAFPAWKLVAPIVEKKSSSKKKTHVLINFGGLQNPYLKNEELAQYAKFIITSVIPFEQKNAAIISTSNAIAKELKAYRPKTYSREQMEQILAQTRYAFMTPGLGNLYEVAAYNIPTVWLPPVNDSQGQQAALLQQEGIVNTALDWSALCGMKINYFGRQELVLKRIAAAITLVANDQQHQQTLAQQLVILQKKACFEERPKIPKLLSRFGTGGASQVAEIVYKYAMTPKRT